MPLVQALSLLAPPQIAPSGQLLVHTQMSLAHQFVSQSLATVHW
jgi:hypothetical protein